MPIRTQVCTRAHLWKKQTTFIGLLKGKNLVAMAKVKVVCCDGNQFNLIKTNQF